MIVILCERNILFIRKNSIIIINGIKLVKLYILLYYGYIIYYQVKLSGIYLF